MPAQWFVVRNNKDHGPFTSTQLKELVTKGSLQEADLVRRSDMKSPVQASKLKGLFEIPEVLPIEEQPKSPSNNAPRVWVYSTLLIILAFSCLPLALPLIWLNKKWTNKQKWGWATAGLCFYALLGITSLGESPKSKTQPAVSVKSSTEEKVDLIPTLVMTATGVALEKEPTGANTSPEEFEDSMRAAAETLGAGNYENTKHLLRIKPYTVKEFVTDQGIRGMIRKYDSRSSATFSKNPKTGKWQLFSSQFGENEWNPIVGIRKKPRS